MAGKKKESAATPQKWEDVPEIPKEEQPYPLPEGWKWVRLKDAYQINPKVEANDNLLASFVPMDKISIGMEGTFTYEIDKWGKIKKGHTRFENGDVAFAKISPCFENGKKMLIQNLKNGIGAGTTELIILRNPYILQKFTLLLLSTEDFIKNGVKTYSGTVGQQRINIEFIRNYLIPLPQLEIQQRIVNRIESLFSKLDEAAEKVQVVIDSHEARKQAILHKAFSGELTRGVEIEEDDYYKEIPEIPKEEQPYPLPGGWKWVSLNNVINLSNETIEEFTGKEIYIGLENLEKGGGIKSYGDSQKIASMKNVFYKDAILYGKLRPYLNKHYISEMDGICSTDISVFYAKNNCLNKFADDYFNTPFFIEYAVKNSKGINLPRVSPKAILNIPFPYPPLKTQQRIVTRIESLFSKLDEVALTYQTTLNIIKKLKKSILHKVFSGQFNL